MPAPIAALVTWLALPTTSGVIGGSALLLTIVGFIVTIYQVRRSRSAAEAARSAAHAVQDQMIRFDVVAECTSAILSLEEIERLHRQGQLQFLPERYNAARKALIQIRALNLGTVIKHSSQLQDGIVQLAALKERGEKLIAEGAASVDVVKSNRIISKMVENLVGLSAELRQEMNEVNPNERS